MVLTFFVGIVLVPTTSYGQTAPTLADLLARVAELQKMLAELQAQSGGTSQVPAPIPTAAVAAEWEYLRPYGSLVVSEESEDSEIILDDWDDLTVFKVDNAKLENSAWRSEDIERTDSYKVWWLFVQIAGQDFVTEHVNEYMTYDLPDEPTLAFVEYINRTDPPWMIYKYASTKKNASVSYPKHSAGWGLAVNIADVDSSDAEETREKIMTLLHEYAHILTLNDMQIDYDMVLPRQTCKQQKRYLFPHGSSDVCAKQTSYLQAFVSRFWNSEHASNGNNFVTKYAATNPREDIAESFTNFILQRKPTDVKDIGDEKILFFYDYPELVSMRDRIRNDIAKYFN